MQLTTKPALRKKQPATLRAAAVTKRHLMYAFLFRVAICTFAATLMLSGCGGADSSGESGATGRGSWDWLSWLVGAIGAIGAVGAAFLGVKATLKTLRHSQYETAAKMIHSGDHRSGGWNYVTRTAAIATLAKLAKDYPDDYDEPVMRAFEAFLSFPPRYGRNAENEGQVDYTSRDTVAIVQTINKRVRKQREAYPISLPPGRPFRITAEGDVEPNPDYEEPKA